MLINHCVDTHNESVVRIYKKITQLNKDFIIFAAFDVNIKQRLKVLTIW